VIGNSKLSPTAKHILELSSVSKQMLEAASARDNRLLANIKESMPTLEALLDDVDSHWGYEDGMYRFYHYSYKVYRLQDETTAIVAALKSIAPTESGMCSLFTRVIADGTSKKWTQEHNADWHTHTRPIVEAYCHAVYFLRMICKYGKELDSAPTSLASGWAAVLELYGIR